MFLIGADPEVFVKQQGVYRSAHNLVPGTKLNPHPVRNGAVQVDGMALEFNIDPSDSEDAWVFNLTSVIAQLREMVPDYEVVADPVATFDPEYLLSQPREALELGCDPDFNAWTGDVNTKPEAVRPIRTGAGHVHIGWTEGENSPEHFALCQRIIKQLDFYLGLPSMFYDNDVERRELYGKAGAFRPKSYGCEYRVLSNRWLASESLMRWVFSNTVKCLASIPEGDLSDKYGDIQDIINSSDKEAAMQIIKAEGIPLPEGV